jgi:hypothetical protein
MTTVVVLADPPVAGRPLSGLAESPVSAEQRAELYRAMLADVCGSVQESGAELLVNFRPPEQLPGVDESEVDAEAELRDALGALLPEPGQARYEVQVGKTDAGRVGNTVTHLIAQEGESGVGVVAPTAPFVGRADVGQGTMKLRSSPVVLGPAPNGRVYFAGFTEPVDFAGAFESPALETLTDRAVDSGHDVDFLPLQPRIERSSDLVDLVAGVRARRRAGRRVPAATAAVVEDLDLEVSDGSVVVGSDSS